MTPVRATLPTEGLPQHLQWAAGKAVWFPDSPVASKRHYDQQIELSEILSATAEDVNRVRTAAAFLTRRPWHLRGGSIRRLIPSSIRPHLLRLLSSRHPNKAHIFPDWPLDLSADVLSDLAGGHSSFRTHKRRVVVTHDLDSLSDQRLFLDKFEPLERRYGVRSVNFIVPFAEKLDHGLLQQIASAGNEIGVHGFDHTGRTAFLCKPHQHIRVRAAFDELAEFSPISYRAPFLLMSEHLLDTVAHYAQIDSSIPTSAGNFPTRRYGCATARPFHHNSIWEVPVSLPRDGQLLALGFSPQQILDTWQNCTREIAAAAGVVVLIVHCGEHFSGTSYMIDTYGSFLEWLSEEDFSFTTFKQLHAQSMDQP